MRDLLCSEQSLDTPEFMHCDSGFAYDVLPGNPGMAFRSSVPNVKSCGNFSDIILRALVNVIVLIGSDCSN